MKSLLIALFCLVSCGELCVEENWMVEKGWYCYCEDRGADDYCPLYNPREWWCAPKFIMIEGKCVFECDYFAIESSKITLNEEYYRPQFTLEQVRGSITCTQDP